MADTLKLEFVTVDLKSGLEIGTMILQAIQEVLSGPRSGKWYPVPGNKLYDKGTPADQRADNYYVKYTGTSTKGEIKGASYQASAPGEAPAVRTGRLRQSFYVTSQAVEVGFKIVVLTNVIYADDLQHGTERMAPRPFLDLALKKISQQLVEKCGDMVFKTVRGEE